MNKQIRDLKLADDDQAFVADKVESGEYGTAADVVSAGLQALRERDAAFDKRLREEVLPVLDHVLAHPETAIPIDEAFARLRARHERLSRP